MSTAAHGGLAVDAVTVDFGGQRAVDAASLHAPLGAVTGLIGPNGAGKTTLFNACSGLVRPISGTVSLFGEDITALSPAARARRGLGRTFQLVQICDAMTVAQNVALGPEAAFVGSNPWRNVYARRRDVVSVAEAARAAMDLCGLTAAAAQPAGVLSTGQRRLVELARAIAGGFRLVLLDEPSAGLDDAETDQLARIIAELVAVRGVGILLVEHDMRLVMAVCAMVYVLDFGHLVFEGPAASLYESDVVRAAYLGDGAR